LDQWKWKRCHVYTSHFSDRKNPWWCFQWTCKFFRRIYTETLMILFSNLYEGKVCLSLLGMWEGDRNESWNPARSSLLQVLGRWTAGCTLSNGSRPMWMLLWRSSVVNTRSNVKNSFLVGGTPTFSWSLDSEPYGLVVGTLWAPKYALFNHPEGHVSTTYHPSRLFFLIIPDSF